MKGCLLTYIQAPRCSLGLHPSCNVTKMNWESDDQAANVAAHASCELNTTSTIESSTPWQTTVSSKKSISSKSMMGAFS